MLHACLDRMCSDTCNFARPNAAYRQGHSQSLHAQTSSNIQMHIAQTPWHQQRSNCWQHQESMYTANSHALLAVNALIKVHVPAVYANVLFLDCGGVIVLNAYLCTRRRLSSFSFCNQSVIHVCSAFRQVHCEPAMSTVQSGLLTLPLVSQLIGHSC